MATTHIEDKLSEYIELTDEEFAIAREQLEDFMTERYSDLSNSLRSLYYALVDTATCRALTGKTFNFDERQLLIMILNDDSRAIAFINLIKFLDALKLSRTHYCAKSTRGDEVSYTRTDDNCIVAELYEYDIQIRLTFDVRSKRIEINDIDY